MKTIIFFSILFYAIALPALGELTPQDLDKIRLVVKEEIKTEITSYLVYALIALIVGAIAIPQLIMAWRSRTEHSLERRVERLAEEIEALKQQRIVNP